MTLAETSMVPAEVITGIIGAIFAGLALLYGKQKGKQEAMTIKEPIPTVPTSKVSTPPTWDAHRALCDRVSRLEDDMRTLHSEVKGVRDEQNEQFRQLMVAGGEREIRISEKIEGFARAIHSRIDEYLKPQPPRRS